MFSVEECWALVGERRGNIWFARRVQHSRGQRVRVEFEWEWTTMAGKLHHEELYRGADKLAKLQSVSLVLCGAGALGSNLADNLTRQGFKTLRVIDHDRIEEHNVSTQIYGESEIGTWKVECLRNRIFRSVGVEIDAVRKELTAQNAKTLLKDAALIVDTFDNSASRK